jgi:hypothetical protein
MLKQKPGGGSPKENTATTLHDACSRNQRCSRRETEFIEGVTFVTRFLMCWMLLACDVP